MSNFDFEKLKTIILEKFDVKINNQRQLYIAVNNSKDIKGILNTIKMNPIIYQGLNIINKDFFSYISDDILLQNNIYIDKINIIEDKGYSLFIDSESKHYGNSDSSHFGKSISEHYEISYSNHFDDSIAYHYDNSRSVHLDNSRYKINNDPKGHGCYSNSKSID